MPAAKSKKSLRQKYPVKMTGDDWQNVYNSLKWDRYCRSGQNPSYDPTLGDRPKQLNKQCGSAVVRLVLCRLAY